jgi:hypothetical protein
VERRDHGRARWGRASVNALADMVNCAAFGVGSERDRKVVNVAAWLADGRFRASNTRRRLTDNARRRV